jgi:hypothetical protein
MVIMKPPIEFRRSVAPPAAATNATNHRKEQDTREERSSCGAESVEMSIPSSQEQRRLRHHLRIQHSSSRPPPTPYKVASMGYEVRYLESKVLMSTMKLMDDLHARDAAAASTDDPIQPTPATALLDCTDDDETMLTFSDGNSTGTDGYTFYSTKREYELQWSPYDIVDDEVGCFVENIMASMDGITKLMSCKLCR